MTRRQPLILAAIAFALSGSAQADAPSAPVPVPTATAAPTPSPEEARDALNREQAEAAQNQVGENYAREDNYADAVKARAATIRRQREAYAAELAAYAARKAQYEADLAKWRASLPPCKATKRRPCPAS